MKKLDVLLMLVLFAGAIVLRIAVLYGSAFDGLYGQDAYAYYDFAGAITAGDAPDNFFWPLGYPLLLSAAFAFFGVTAFTGQLINILLGSALSPLIYGLTHAAGGGRRAGFSAGLLMGLSGQALQSSIVLMSDIPALFWGTASAAVMLHFISRPFPQWKNRKRIIFLSAALAFLALGGISRWIYVLLALPWLLTLWIARRGRIDWRTLLWAISAALVVLLPQALYSRRSLAPPLTHAWVQGWSPHNAFSKNFTNLDGHFQYPQINALYYARPFYDAYYLAPVLTPFLLAGILALWKNRAALVLIGGWVLLPYLFLAGIPYQNIRFPLIILPSVVLLVGLGIEFTLERLRYKIVPAGIIITLLVGIGMMLSTGITITHQFIVNQQGDKDAAAWAKGRIPSGASVYTFGLTLTLRHYTDLQVYELYYETPATLAEKYQPGKVDYVFVNVWNIENQWDGREPQMALHWLRDQRRLIRLGKIGNYVLYRTGA